VSYAEPESGILCIAQGWCPMHSTRMVQDDPEALGHVCLRSQHQGLLGACSAPCLFASGVFQEPLLPRKQHARSASMPVCTGPALHTQACSSRGLFVGRGQWAMVSQAHGDGGLEDRTAQMGPCLDLGIPQKVLQYTVQCVLSTHNL